MVPSIQAKAEAVQTAITSVSTCSPTTIAYLKELLTPGGKDVSTEGTSSSTRATIKPTRGRATPSTRPTASKSTREELPETEKKALAVNIVNTALKALSAAAKPQPAEARAPAERKRLRRSNSTPMSPLPPRTLNRTSTSPMEPKSARQPSSAAEQTAACLPLVECLRAAFSYLRSIQDSGKKALPDNHLELGMSRFISTMITLGAHEQAQKEVAIMKRRLDVLGKRTSEPPAKRTLADLLDFGDAEFSGSILELAASTQLQVLRLIAEMRNSALTEAALPMLRSTCPCSPQHLLHRMSTESSSLKTKAARQLQQFSQTFLSIAPSISSSEDAIAMEARLSPRPHVALEYQALAFEYRLYWWSMAVHQADIDEDLLRPFSKCLLAFQRRCPRPTQAVYQLCVESNERLNSLATQQGLTPATASTTPTATIYQALGTIAANTCLHTEASLWFSKLRQRIQPEQDSAARCCSVAARLLASTLKQESVEAAGVEPLMQELLDAMQGPLRGDTSELDDMFDSLCAARRAAVRLLMDDAGSGTKTSEASMKRTVELCRNLTVQFPRFACRWLGKAPPRDGDTKKILRFEQRRQVVSGHGPQILDSATVVIKTLLDEEKISWDEVDTALQSCIALVDGLGELNLPMPKGDGSNTYHVKVSQLYFLLGNCARRKNDVKLEYRSLKRSIDVAKDRSSKEKERAMLPRKLERYSTICKQGGRQDDARDALKAICTTMVEDGVLAQVAKALNEKSPSIAWAADPRAESLSRTLVAMVKLDKSWNDWTFFLPDLERAAVLEHIVHIILAENTTKCSKVAEMSGSVTDALLRIYSVERFPVRRLRTLLQLMAMALDEKDRFEELRSQIEQALQTLQAGHAGQDASLSGYIPHLQAYLSSMVAMTSPDSSVSRSELRSAIGIWKRILGGCKTNADLVLVIDYPERSIKHFESLSHFAALKGDTETRVSASELAADVSRLSAEESLRSLLLSYSSLADTYVSLGYESKAEDIFSRVSQLPIDGQSVCGTALANLHLSAVEFYLSTHQRSKAEAILEEAKLAFEKQSNRTTITTLEKLLTARAHIMYSLIALEKGEALQALHHAKYSTRILYATWTRLETRPQPDESLNESVTSKPLQIAPQLSGGPDFWVLGAAVLRSLLRMSAVYQHLGMFQETLYYAEKALEVANGMNSPSYISQAQSWVGALWIKANDPEKGLPSLDAAKEFVLSEKEPTHFILRLACELSASYGQMKDHDNAAQLMEAAESMLEALGEKTEGAKKTSNLTEEMERLTLKPTATRTTRATRATKAATAKAPVTRVTRKPATQARPGATAAASVSTPTEKFPALRKLMFIRKAFVLIGKGEWTAAAALLDEARQIAPMSEEPLEAQVNVAMCLIGESLEQMISDSVFAVVQDSTISFPSVASPPSTQTTPDKAAAVAEPTRKVRGRAAATKTQSSGHEFVQTLQRALQHLTEAHARAIITGNGHLIHRIAALLQSTTIFLSAASGHDPKALPHARFATCSMELARNITWKRERRAVLVDNNASQGTEFSWPSALDVEDGSSHNAVTDMAKFQREYVNMIPPAWKTISISLSDNRHDLCITKLEAGKTPFVLRLPLERASSREADVGVFDFETGRSTLQEIIRESNDTCHSRSRDWSVPGAKVEWWKEREALDAKMQELVEMIEEVWLNGFKGIFSQHQHHAGLLAKFQKAFYSMLDKHLPSRRPGGGKKTAKAAKITLDTRILDLFIGLGSPSEEGDMVEALQDLLYFVVDILQFHGERNAYDELDFDAMTIDAMDALHAYHEAAQSQSADSEPTHTILVLDKPLHAFPWESLPCMQGQATSRVPSMECLRRLILEQQQDADRAGHTVSAAKGTYMLNPGKDLVSTQKTFEKPLAALQGDWTSFVGTGPSDAEFETALQESDVLVYIGHGSGAQYVRNKTIRRLEKCRATALLMGCSSASLVDAGEFEVHGTVWNYMMAGCPAVVGTLWDVTDKDIDRYASRLLEEWGLVEDGTFPTDKWSQKKSKEERAKAGPASLIEAVDRSRDACRFRYITAGAVCVYGIPVYVRKD